MKVVILAGGYGTRISEESRSLPKPLIEINSKPILWHVMSIFSHYGLKDFVVHDSNGYRIEYSKSFDKEKYMNQAFKIFKENSQTEG